MDYKKVFEYFSNVETITSHFHKKYNGDCTGKFIIDMNKGMVESFSQIFDSAIDKKHFDDVVNGQGEEKDKIDTLYSSSLQSLLFFDQIGEKDLTIKFSNGDTVVFNKVFFEYKNIVIDKNKYPSCLDVVLISKDDKSICFIESKLIEIIRDSTTEGTYKVGISYFHEKHLGFDGTLHLSKKDLDTLKVTYPSNGPYLKSVRGKSLQIQSINKLTGSKYVYSYGIKQVLAHLIGIENFKTCSFYKSGDPIGQHLFENYYYLELYNKLPGFKGDADYKKKINNFKRHFNIVKKIIQGKGIVKSIDILSYQQLYRYNKGLVNRAVERYYRLNK